VSAPIWLTIALLLASPAHPANRGASSGRYHLQLEAYPAAPFPFLSRFGSVTIDLYPHGLRVETLWLNAFSTVGSKSVTVENPLSRTYSDIALAEIASDLQNLSTYGTSLTDPPVVRAPLKGTVRGMEATRYRFEYGATAWLDLWTTSSFPENAQMRALELEVVRGIAPGTAAALKSVSGTPVYVELNFRRFRKVVLLRVKSLAFDTNGESSALKPGALYFKAPSWEEIWK
jgi:hypothetical protein